MRKITDFWQKTLWSKLILIGLGLFLWPFVLGGGISYLLASKIKNSLLKWILVLPILVFSVLFGTSWVMAITSPQVYKPKPKSFTLVTLSPTPGPLSSPSLTPVSELSPTVTPMLTLTVEPTIIPTIRPTTKPTIEPTTRPTNSPTLTPKTSLESPEQKFQEIGSKVAKESSVTALQQSDGTWVVTNIINDWPELFAEFGVKTWVRNFMYEVYHSGYPIKQVGVTITAPRHIGKYVRAWLGVNQAKTITDDYWKNYLLPTNFYNWLIDVETGRNEPDRANRTFVEDNL